MGKKFTRIPMQRKAAKIDSPAPPPEPNQHTHTGQSRVRKLAGQREIFSPSFWTRHVQ